MEISLHSIFISTEYSYNFSDKALVEKLGRFAAEQINEQLRFYKIEKDCHNVTLEKVEKAEQLVLPGNLRTKFDAEAYNVTFTVAAPARGRFHILLRVEKDRITLGADNFYRLDSERAKCTNIMITMNDYTSSLCTCKK
ncbi:hypothetical protein Y032_0060g3094 [Ancylostoma ceylanicum]|uniref:Uncharacterized protein n=1 Tax=Ancylostoma ceylanicum TaxID=53326 RepID=A0A016U443_9BILA|nr:hypothetical protein Y032_0060g3094 [Ancylostoma ceylanicum]